MSKDAARDDRLPNNLLIFRATVAKSCEEISKCVSEKEFLDILTILKSKPSIVKKLHNVMEDDLYKALESNLDELVTDECIVEGMKKLNYLIEETEVPPNVEVWRPPGDVDLHLRSLDAEKIINESKRLEDYIRKLENENEELMKKITKRRESVQSVHQNMKQLLNGPFKLLELENVCKFNQECIEKLHDS